MKKIDCYAYCTDGNLVQSGLDEKIGFALEISADDSEFRQILTFKEIKDLQEKILRSLNDREFALNQNKVKRSYANPVSKEKILSRLEEKDKYLVSFEPSEEEIKGSNDIDAGRLNTRINRISTPNGKNLSVEFFLREGDGCDPNKIPDDLKNTKSLNADYDLKALQNTISK